MNEPSSAGSPQDADAGAANQAAVAGQDTSSGEGTTAETEQHNGHGPRAQLVREAITMIKQHPLGAVATVAAATAFLEVELAVGILAGIGATALLANQSGPEARQRVLAQGKRALDRARVVIAKSKQPPQVAPPV